MNDERKTKKQLLEELGRERERVEREKERSDALYQVSNRLAGVHDTDEVLELIVNEAARLVGATAGYMRLLEAGELVISASTDSVADYLSASRSAVPVEERTSNAGHVMATKKPLVSEDSADDEFIHPGDRRLLDEHGFHGRASVPIVANDRSIGVLVVVDKRIRRFTEDEVSLLTAFADQAALALEKARLLNDAQREKERSDALYRISNLLAGAHDTDEVLDLIVNEAARLLGSSGSVLWLLEGDRLKPGATTESAAAYLAEVATIMPSVPVIEGENILGHIMAAKKPQIIEDLSEEAMIAPGNRQLLRNHGFHSAAAVPLLADDRALGVLAVIDGGTRLFTDEEVAVLTAFADQASLALEKARLLNEAEREKERSDALYQVSNRLAGAHDTDEVLDLIVNEAARLLGTDAAYIRLLDGDMLVIRAKTDSIADYLTGASAVALMEGTSNAGHVMATKKPLVMEDATKEEIVSSEQRLRLEEHGFHGRATVPLLANGRSIGVLAVTDKQIRRFTQDEVSLLAAFADQAALALEKARLLNEAEREKERSDALYQISNQLAGVHDTDEVLDLIVNEAARLLGAPFVLLRLIEEGVLVPRAATEPAAAYAAGTVNVVEGGTSAAGHVMAIKEPFHGEEMVSPKALQRLRRHGFYGTAVYPLLANGRSIGTLSIADRRIRRLTDDEASLFSAFADQASLASEKARLLNEAEARERQATQLYEVTTQLASNHDLDSVLGLIAARAVELLGCEGSAIFEYDPIRDGLTAAKTFNFPPDWVESLFFRPGEATAGMAFQQRKPIWARDLLADPTLVISNPQSEEAVRVAGVEAPPRSQLLFGTMSTEF